MEVVVGYDDEVYELEIWSERYSLSRRNFGSSTEMFSRTSQSSSVFNGLPLKNSRRLITAGMNLVIAVRECDVLAPFTCIEHVNVINTDIIMRAGFE